MVHCNDGAATCGVDDQEALLFRLLEEFVFVVDVWMRVPMLIMPVEAIHVHCCPHALCTLQGVDRSC